MSTDENATEDLPLIKADGSWIDEPAFYIIARMAIPDSVTDGSVEQAYATLLATSNTSPDLTVFEEHQRKLLRRYLTQRTLAGSVVINLLRARCSGDLAPKLSRVQNLTAHQYREGSERRPTLDAANREVRRAFSDFRRSNHLQAAASLEPEIFGAFGESVFAVPTFLALSSAIANLVSEIPGRLSQNWQPYHVPTSTKPTYHCMFEPFSKAEHQIMSDATTKKGGE